MSIVDVLKTSLRRNWRRASQTWKLYRRSKIGLIGLSIMLGFVIVAVFAPVIAPYDPQFAAPNEDVFRAHSIFQPLSDTGTGILIDTANETWNRPVVEYAPPPESNVVSILVYSAEGHAIRYDAGFTTVEEAMVMELTHQATIEGLPEDIAYMEFADLRRKYYITVSNSTYYELDYSTFSPSLEFDMGFVPTYFSNLWWAQSRSYVDVDKVCLAMANTTTVMLITRAPIGQAGGGHFIDLVDVSAPDENITDLRIVGNPIVMLDTTLDNGTLLVVPTDKALLAYEIVVTENVFGVNNVTIGDVVWFVDYEDLEDQYDTTINPVEKYTVTMENLDPRHEERRNFVFASNPGGGRPGQMFAFLRNGSFDWWVTLTVPEMRNGIIDGVFPSDRQGLLVTASEDILGLIANIEVDTGRIDENVTEYSVVEGKIISVPQFVIGNKRYILTTDQDKVYMLRESIKVDVVFSIAEGIQVPSVFLGNPMTEQQIVGNYYGIITDAGVLFAQSLGGSYIAPLPPGQGSSGNWYILGTDVFGHDVFTQLVYGTQNELIVGLTAAFIAVGIGTLIGMVAGYFGGIIDSILMRFTDIFLTLPILVIALLLAAVLGPSLFNLIIVIAVFSWAGLSRVIRAQTLSIKERDFIKAAKVAGAGHRQIIFRHIAPNVLPFTFLYMAYIISGAIVTEAILSFLGMGDPTSITWGMMLQYLRISGHTLDAPWWFLPPGIAITLLSLSFYLIGRAFDEVVNPRLRAR